MNSNSTGTILGTVALIAIIGFGIWFFFWYTPPVTIPPITNNTNPIINPISETTTTTTLVNRISLAFLDIEGTTQGKSRGCDRVVKISYDIPATTTPLTAALRALFNEDRELILGSFNFLARTNDTLKFERASVTNGTAHIYLTGNLSGLAGICDDPRAQIQIEETALQFGTVQRVQLYLNGQATILTPSQR